MNNAFTAKRVEIPSLKDFDVDYIDYEVVDVATKIGKDDTDVKLSKKVVYSKTNISDLIESQAASVGVDNLMRAQGSLGDVVVDDGVVDYTVYPTDPAALKVKAQSAAKIYEKIPEELKKGRSIQEFVDSLTKDEFTAWVDSLKQNKNDGGSVNG